MGNKKSNIASNKNEEELMTINFVSIDEKIHCSFICKITDIFNQVENLLYMKYPEYKEFDNNFIANGHKVNKNKKLKENNIRNNDIIILFSKYEI